MPKKVLRVLSAAAVGASVAVLPAAVPAQAATGFYACPKGYFCGWSGPDATGGMIKIKSNMPTRPANCGSTPATAAAGSEPASSSAAAGTS